MTFGVGEAEEARARMLTLLPEGFEEVDRGDTLELAGYVGAEAELRVRAVFGDAVSEPVPEDARVVVSPEPRWWSKLIAPFVWLAREKYHPVSPPN